MRADGIERPASQSVCAAVRSERVERAGFDQRAQRLRLESGASDESVGAIKTVALPLFHDQPRRLGSNVLDHAQAEPHCAVLRLRPDLAAVDAGVEEGHAEAAGVFFQRLDRVEPHRLVVDERGEELQGVVTLEPGGLVGGDRERVRVRLREHVAAVDLGEDALSRVRRDAVRLRPFEEPLAMHLDQALAVLTREGAAHLVGLGRRHAGHVHDQLHDLFLPDDDPVAPLQRALLQRMVVLPLGPVAVAVDELRDGTALRAHTGPDQRLAQVPDDALD